MKPRILLGRERTIARRYVAILSTLKPLAVARLLGMKRHSIVPLLDGRRRPGRTFLDAATRILPVL